MSIFFNERVFIPIVKVRTERALLYETTAHAGEMGPFHRKGNGAHGHFSDGFLVYRIQAAF